MTVESVFDEVREWQSDDGKIHLFYVHGAFDDGSEWDFGVQQQNVDKSVDRMEKLIGSSGWFELEDRGEYQDIQQYKVLNYPGKPNGATYPGEGEGGGTTTSGSSGQSSSAGAQQSSSGGGGGRSGDWETAPERMFKNLSIEAQGALGKLATIAAACITVHRTTKTETANGAEMVTVTEAAAFSPGTFHDIVSAMVTEVDSLAGAVRETAERTPQGKPEAALAAHVPAAAPVVAEEAASPPLGQVEPAERLRILNDLMAAYGSPNKVKAAWEDTWPDRGESPEVENMTSAEAATLLMNAASVTAPVSG